MSYKSIRVSKKYIRSTLESYISEEGDKYHDQMLLVEQYDVQICEKISCYFMIML